MPLPDSDRPHQAEDRHVGRFRPPLPEARFGGPFSRLVGTSWSQWRGYPSRKASSRVLAAHGRTTETRDKIRSPRRVETFRLEVIP